MSRSVFLRSVLLCILLYLCSAAVIFGMCILIQRYIPFMSWFMLWPFGFGFVPHMMAAFGSIQFSLGIVQSKAESTYESRMQIIAVLICSCGRLVLACMRLDSAGIISLILACMYCLIMRNDLIESHVSQTDR